VEWRASIIVTSEGEQKERRTTVLEKRAMDALRRVNSFRNFRQAIEYLQ